jgi:hypothetical protein
VPLKTDRELKGLYPRCCGFVEKVLDLFFAAGSVDHNYHAPRAL